MWMAANFIIEGRRLSNANPNANLNLIPKHKLRKVFKKVKKQQKESHQGEGWTEKQWHTRHEA